MVDNIERYKQNIEYWYQQSTGVEYFNGANWYLEAHDYAVTLSVRYGVSVMTAALVLALLSPRNKWRRNKVDADTLLSAYKNGVPPETVTVATFHANRDKAWAAIAAGDDVDVLSLTGREKVYYFYLCIINPTDWFPVCVDSWAYEAANGERGNVTEKRRQDVQNAYTQVALAHGLIPSQLQAIVWLTIRRERGES